MTHTMKEKILKCHRVLRLAAVLEIIYQRALVSIKATTVRECDTDINDGFYLQKMCHELK